MADQPDTLDFDDSELDVDVQPNEKLTAKVMLLDEVTARIAKGEKLLKELKEQKTKLERDELPAVMQELGTNVYGIPDTDRECRIKPYYHATFPKENVDEAVKYLEEHQIDGVVSHTLQVKMPKGKGEEAKQIQQRVKQMLAEYDIEVEAELIYGAHWKSYTAMVKEQHEGGLNLPLTLLNATIGQIATIKKRK